MIPEQSWVYRARMVPAPLHADGVIDGDTLSISIDLGFGAEIKGRMRLLGVNCPEMTGATKAAGMAAAWFTAEWIARAVASGEGWPLILQTHRLRDQVVREIDNFGRYLALAWRSVDGRSLADDLVEAGHATTRVAT